MMRAIAGLSMLAAVLLSGGTSHAQTFPARTVTIVVPYEAGGGVDRLARLIAEQLQQAWGSSVVVENRVGANGNIGSDYVARAAPDGHTLLYAPPGPLVINKLIYDKLNYDSDRFVPISLVAISPNVLVVHPKLAAQSVQELIAFAKANPDRLNYASPGVGGTPHLTAELFKLEAGISMVHVPFKGTGSLLTNLLGGYVDLTFSELGNVLEHVRAKGLRALAVASEKRNRALPDVPALAEILPNVISATWSGLVAPPGTPDAIVQRIHTTLMQAFGRPEAVKRMVEASHLDPVLSTPEAMAQQIRSERERWSKVVRAMR